MRKKVPSALLLILLLFGATVVVVSMLTLPTAVSAWQPQAYDSDQPVIGCCFGDCPQDPADVLAGYMIVAPFMGLACGILLVSLDGSRRRLLEPLRLK